ncbi:MAG TPA: dihydrolipoamide acetyltransferase family protein [Bacteroidales bacterium]|nr:dihydrolipoamide acetyltransferase family protein [Bacteroidales bacterium]
MPEETKVKVNYELILPSMGEGIIEATITKWLVSPGQHVSIDQPLVEVATDKVDSEIPSPVEGTVVNLVYREGEIPNVGEVIALIETEGKATEKLSVNSYDLAISGGQSYEKVKPPRQTRIEKTADVKVMPLVRMLARQHGIGADELKLIKGTGTDGEITMNDVNQYIMEGRLNHKTPDAREVPVDQVQKPEIRLNAGDEIVEMDRMRKLIASHMISSKRTAAHVTSFLEADVTLLVKWREEQKEKFLKRENIRLTFTPVFIEAVAQTLKEYPRINVSVSGESIIFRKGINIGIATALADGNLIVPVIKNADHENLGGLSRKLSDLADRARKGALHPEEIKGGTFTITNIGQYNNLTGTPIINQPESAILAFGTILKKPWAVKTADGYGVAVRDIMMLALTYDHRVIDGALGGSFLNNVVQRLENFDIRREV